MFVETVVDASADGSLQCGSQVCEAGVTECCFQKAGPTLMCIPIGSPCDGQVSLCDGDEDCPSFDGGSYHCCGVLGADQVRCLPSCTGESGTVLLCHSGADCPRNAPVCQRTSFNGRDIQACTVPGE